MMMMMIEINDEINELLAHTTLEEQRQVKFLSDMDNLIASVDASKFEVGGARARAMESIRFDSIERRAARRRRRRVGRRIGGSEDRRIVSPPSPHTTA